MRLRPVLALAALLGITPLGVAKELMLASNGHSDYVIVGEAQAAAPEQFAAQELQKYIFLASGVKVPIVEHKSGAGAIWIGRAADPRVRAELNGKSEDSYLVRISRGDVYLVGASPRGTLYSVYDFLEKYVGCGWVAPGDDSVPLSLVIKLPEAVDRIESPAFAYRAISLFPMADEQFNDKLRIDSLFPFALSQVNKDRIDWAAKNRLSYVVPCTNEYGPELWEKTRAREELVPEVSKRGLALQCCGHSYFAWVPPAKYFKDHPEYYAVLTSKKKPAGAAAGESWPETLNIANPEVAAVMAKNIDDFLNKNPEVSVITVWMNDTNAHCTTPECLEMEGPARLSITQPRGGYPPIYTFTEAALKFANQVARLVYQTHPKVMISHLAYAANIDAPVTVKPEKNILVTFAPLERAPFRLGARAGYYSPINDPGNEWNKTFLQEMQKWLALTRNFYVWDYYSLWWIFSSNRPRWEFPILDTIASDLRYYRDQLGLTRVSSEIADWHEENMYAYARLAWNPDLAWREILEDFCRRSYGAAYEPMLQQWLVLESAKERWFEKREECERYLNIALKKAETTATRARIDRAARLWRESACQKEGDPVGPCPQ